MRAFRDDLVGLRFVSASKRHAFVVHANHGGEKNCDYRIVATRIDGGTHPEVMDAPAEFEPGGELGASNARARLGTLRAELSPSLIGCTLSFMFARPNPDAERYGDFAWIGVENTTPTSDIVVFLEHGGSPFDDDWDWQDGWYYPYEEFRVAPAI